MKAGDYVDIETKDGRKFSGLVMNSADISVVSLKLNSGYNLGIDKKNIKTTKVGKAILSKIEIKKTEKIDFDPNKKTITILHTGGTVASRVSYKTGAVAPSFSPEQIVEMFPELKEIVNVKSRLISNMFSGDMRFGHWNLIAKEIEKELKDVDGVIVTHGTDTMAYTSSALGFILENLSKPVILVGAQRSSDRPSSDAGLNLICAANFIKHSDFNQVAICMHSKSEDDGCYILPAFNTKKLHTSRRDAFKVVNGKPIAFVSKSGSIIKMEGYKKKEVKDKLKLKLINDKLKIGVLKAHPNLFKEEVKMFAKFNGLVIEGTGLGHLSVDKIDEITKENTLVLNEIGKLSKLIPVVMTSQCIFGTVNMNVYQYGRELQKAGVIGNLHNMTFETAFVKLAWLLSNFKKTEIKDLFAKNINGEVSERVAYEEEFI
ncbi:MAG TPA: Glu-tRNA(Gln) amidotransferase subunit GatD [Candidatus Nanoarchaeia archaeon]|nr:Glu-tRNA(Gln) amidotransferase subunit GatD [Candidatus Nanoarchaeia archaeon]